MQSSDSFHGFGYTFWTFWIIVLHLLYKLWISNILATCITEETCIVEMRIWCRNIGTVNVITSSTLLIFVTLSFCLVSFVTYSDIRLELLLNWDLLCVLLCVCFYTLPRCIGEVWDLKNTINPAAMLRLFHVRSLWTCIIFNFSFLCVFRSIVWRPLSLNEYTFLFRSQL